MANRPKPQRVIKKLNRGIGKVEAKQVYGMPVSKKEIKKSDKAGKKVMPLNIKQSEYRKAQEKKEDYVHPWDSKRDPNKGKVVGKSTGTSPDRRAQKWNAKENNVKPSIVAKKKNGK